MDTGDRMALPLWWVPLLPVLLIVVTAGVVAVDEAAAARARGAREGLLGSAVVPLRRTHEAMGDLTRRFGLGQMLGLAGTMVVGLAAGPRAAAARSLGS